MEQAEPFGWTTFDASISRLYEQGKITEETAMAYATKRAIVKRSIDRIKSARGEKTTDIEGLKIDSEYQKNFGI